MAGDIYSYRNYRKFLSERTAQLKAEKRFNLRAFAKRAGIKAPGYLKMVVDGRRNLTVETAEKFCRALEITGREKEYFEKLVLYNQTRDPDLKKTYYDELSRLRPRTQHYVAEQQHSQYFSRPHYVFIREMVVLKDFREDYKWIAKRCSPPIRPTEAKEAVEALLNLGLLKRNAQGNLEQTEDFVRTEDIQTQIAEAYHYHEAMIDLARHALARLPQKERNYYALTMPMPKEMFDEVVDEFYAFRDRVLEKISNAGKPHDDVYQINFQLFPVTRKKRGTK
jgi:uncharacterized protein (TIGR02147 family)